MAGYRPRILSLKENNEKEQIPRARKRIFSDTDQITSGKKKLKRAHSILKDLDVNVYFNHLKCQNRTNAPNLNNVNCTCKHHHQCKGAIPKLVEKENLKNKISTPCRPRVKNNLFKKKFLEDACVTYPHQRVGSDETFEKLVNLDASFNFLSRADDLVDINANCNVISKNSDKTKEKKEVQNEMIDFELLPEINHTNYNYKTCNGEKSLNVVNTSIPPMKRQYGEIGVQNICCPKKKMMKTVQSEIDFTFINNELCQTFKKTYFNDLMEHYFLTQKATYLILDHNQISYRKYTINWMIKLHIELSGPLHVLFGSITLLDRFLQIVKVPWNFFKLAGLASLRIQFKYHETPNMDYKIWKKFAMEAGYDTKQLNKMEMELVNAVQFDFSWPDPSIFVEYHLDMIIHCKTKLLENCIYFIVESFVQNPSSLIYTPAEIAAGSILISLICLKSDSYKTIWNELNLKMKSYIAYEWSTHDLRTIKRDIIRSLNEIYKDENYIQSATIKKYSTKQYDYVSKILKTKLDSNIFLKF